MKRIFLTSFLVLSAVVSLAAQSFADNKGRISGGGFSRSGSRGSVSGGQSVRPVTGRTGLSNGLSGAGKTVSGNSGLSSRNPAVTRKPVDFKNPATISRPGNLPAASKPARPESLVKPGSSFAPGSIRKPESITKPDFTRKPDLIGKPDLLKPDFAKRPDFTRTPGFHNKPEAGIQLPPMLKPENRRPGHVIELPDGRKKDAVAVDVRDILKHKDLKTRVYPHIDGIVKTAPKHLCQHHHFHWWVTVCHHHCHTHYGCWNVDVNYWNCWTPCNWQIVRCEELSYYLGMSCIHIPDMQAFGVQSVVQGSPAHEAGLLPGDLILSVNGQPAFDTNLVNAEMANGRLDLAVVRDGSDQPILMTVFPRLVQAVSF